MADGIRNRQEIAVRLTGNTRQIRGIEVSRIPGLFQTPEYARVVFDSLAEFRASPRRPRPPSRSGCADKRPCTTRRRRSGF
ncbi:Scr1 family TA system antitoxin-like transcriptional regulator [Streptomyces sanglieri]|uniref:Scr1 family TA system antitoxin-like transcriptional regulator n=1 Tax=Streptomyces sanglieri TaxID=193460 RepID=A0ABW2WW73_9ACTN